MKERKVRIPTALMLMVLAVVGTFNITYFTATEYYNRLLEDLQTQETRYKKLKEVTDIVDKYYVGDYEEADALELAAAGYVAGLGDVWSGYYTAEQTASIREEESNQYVGIGVSYGIQEDNLYEITAVTPGGPADKAGMLPGDRLLTADGVDVNTLESPDDLGALVKGEVGTLVTITVDRAGEELTFQITRDTILVYSVTSQLLEGSVGYIAISDFNSNVEKEFRSHMESLTAQNDLIQRSRTTLFQRPGGRDKIEGRSGPHQSSRLLPLDLLQQKKREHKQLLWQDMTGSAALQCLIDILHGQVKVKRRLICHNVLMGKAAGLRHPLRKIDDRPMGYDDSLRRSRRPRGEDGIRDSGISPEGHSPLQSVRLLPEKEPDRDVSLPPLPSPDRGRKAAAVHATG